MLFALYLTWQGIDFDQTFQLLVRYNAISNVNLGIHLGLLQSILASRLLFARSLLGCFPGQFAFTFFGASGGPEVSLTSVFSHSL